MSYRNICTVRQNSMGILLCSIDHVDITDDPYVHTPGLSLLIPNHEFRSSSWEPANCTKNIWRSLPQAVNYCAISLWVLEPLTQMGQMITSFDNNQSRFPTEFPLKLLSVRPLGYSFALRSVSAPYGLSLRAIGITHTARPNLPFSYGSPLRP